MRFLSTLALVGTASAQAASKGFNYGSTFTDGSAKQQADFEAEFSRAQSLPGTSGFTSARLYTMIQGGTANTPISAIPAAIDTQTTLLLGLWASAGEAIFQNELDALSSAINQYGSAFTDLIVGISVGSEDLYRISPTGIENNSGLGADPQTLVDYVKQVRSTISGTSASGSSIGHVDTWTAWVNGSNNALIEAIDWLGMDAYPYFQNTISNSIEVGNSTFFEAYDNTVGAAQGKSVWVTETGWPVSGPQENQAFASIANSKTYWDEVGCGVLFDNINTWWYILQDALPTTPSPSFGIIGAGSLEQAPLFDLSCPAGSNGDSSSAASSATSAASSAASPAKPSSAAVSSTASIAQSPGPETSPASATIVQTSAASTSASASSYKPEMTTVTSASLMSSKEDSSMVYSTAWFTITSCPNGCPTSLVTLASVPSGVSSNPAASAYKSATINTPTPSPASGTAAAAASPSASVCPANLNGQYQYPHLIVPVSASNPDKAYGTSYNGTITPDIKTIFNFDLPASYAGKTCSLVFLFPDQKALETSAYTFNGQGGISVSELTKPATEQTTYNSVPAVANPLGAIETLKSGNSYVIGSHGCAAGHRQSFEFSSTGGLALEYFQDHNPSPLGAYITVC